MSSVDNAYRIGVQTQAINDLKPLTNGPAPGASTRFTDDDGFEFSKEAQQLASPESSSQAAASADDPLGNSYPLPPSHP